MADDDPRDSAGPPTPDEPAPATPNEPTAAAPSPAGPAPAGPAPDEPASAEPPTEWPSRTEPIPAEPSEPSPTEPGATQPLPSEPVRTERPSAESAGPEQPTQAMPASPGDTSPDLLTRPGRTGAGDETVLRGPAEVGPSGTGVMPAVPEPVVPPRWSARAQVRPPEQDDLGSHWDEAGSEWDQPEPRERRSLLGPALITVLVLVLLAILAFGIWLVVRSQDTGSVPAPTETPASTTSTTTRPPPTTTAAPPTTAPTTAPVTLAIPNVAGLDYDSADAQLRALGFRTTRTNRTSTTVPAGNVIGTDPAIGTDVPNASKVTIIVSSGAPTTSPAVRTPTPTPAAT